MYWRAAAAYFRSGHLQSTARSNSKLRMVSEARVLPIKPRCSNLRNVRFVSASSVPRTSAVLAYAPTQTDLEATEEFCETETIPREKAMLKITDAAAEQLRNISMRENDENIALRVLVESGGCHGYQYKMELTSKRQPSD
ncbi:[4Fe-4S] proteins maturation [Ceratobasidium sp. 395]|nr:[4Fe-4S] proteins maturation [Ceratobasidium sp. 395]